MRNAYVRQKQGFKFPPTKTVPAQSLTVPELFERFRKGLPVTANTRQPVYTDSNEDLEKLSRMSAMDKYDMAAEMSQQAKQTERELIERANEESERLKAEQQKSAGEGEKA